MTSNCYWRLSHIWGWKNVLFQFTRISDIPPPRAAFRPGPPSRWGGAALCISRASPNTVLRPCTTLRLCTRLEAIHSPLLAHRISRGRNISIFKRQLPALTKKSIKSNNVLKICLLWIVVSSEAHISKHESVESPTPCSLTQFSFNISFYLWKPIQFLPFPEFPGLRFWLWMIEGPPRGTRLLLEYYLTRRQNSFVEMFNRFFVRESLKFE